MESSSLPPPPPPGDTSAILLSLLHLPAHRLASLRRAASLDLRVLRQRLAGLLLSPALFSLALSRVRSLPLSSKSSLLARLLLAPLHRFASASDPLLPPSPSSRLPPRDLDAAVLLLAMCDSIHPRDDAPLSEDDWRRRIAWRLSASALSPTGLGPEAGFGECVEMAAKCGRLLAAEGEGEGGKEGRSAAAAVEAVLRLEEVAAGWCAVCREQTAAVACGMPCGHRFHWSCILPWLRRRNTCPCCRFELPADDVFCEVRRLWRAITAAGRSQRSQTVDCSRRWTEM